MDPTLIGGMPPMRSVSLMNNTACAISMSDELWCWGANNYGQLGNGTTEYSEVPVRVAIGPVQSVATSTHGICAVLRDGTMRCWGENRGSIGDGTMEDRSLPTAPRWR
jgi:alpha-tubulin suppressor-like RCC1 family protein